jgi:hypothetical protein
MAEDVRLSVTQGPVIIRGLDDAGVNATHALWDGIVASEWFPPGAGCSGANYVLTLKKGVDHWNEVRHAEDDLTKALLMLVAAWPFAGGSYMTLDTREVIYSPRFESNAAELERTMMERCGVARVTSVASMPMSSSTTYSQPPLCLATRIARLMHSDPDILRLLFYHQKSVLERAHPSWFISLFQVRDFFSEKYGQDEVARKILGITLGKWRYFGTKLGPLRHAGGSAQSVSSDDINKLYELAASWVASYIRTKGIPALPA